MIRNRINPRPVCNDNLCPLEGPALPSAWVRAAAAELGAREGVKSAYVLLSGGCDLVGFRVRVAQCQVRADTLPSLFSDAALLFLEGSASELFSVPLWGDESPGTVPRRNGIAQRTLESLDRAPMLVPNLALLSLPVDDVGQLRGAVDTLRGARLSVDLVSPIPCWLGYAWGAAKVENPLRNLTGHPSAMFVESCYAACRVDVAPGLSERVLCPEVIWQGIKWWPDTFEGKAAARHRLLQEQAAASYDE